MYQSVGTPQQWPDVMAKSEAIRIEDCGLAGDIAQAAVGLLAVLYPNGFD